MCIDILPESVIEFDGTSWCKICWHCLPHQRSQSLHKNHRLQRRLLSSPPALYCFSILLTVYHVSP